MGGLKVTPDLPLSAFVPKSADILILPGGQSWMKGVVPEVSEAVQAMVTLDRPVAAICAATLALAHCGLLDNHLHTSNGKNFIGQYVREYRGLNAEELFYRLLREESVTFVAHGLARLAAQLPRAPGGPLQRF